MTHAPNTLSLALLLLTCGCGSDGGGSVDATTAGASTSGGAESTGGADGAGESTAALDSSSEGGSSTGAGDTGSASTDSAGGACGGVDCTENEECIDEACVPVRPPPMCDAPVIPSDPACAPCIARQCCGVVQACYGDGSVRAPTDCAELQVCVDEQCADSETLEDFEACAFADCGATEADFDALFATFSCVGKCVARVGPGNEESCGVAPR